jgi:cleavage and polyadenylation specificity factor subunit 1
MSSTNTVHPATLSTFAPTGCELSTWAYITTKRPPTNRSHADTGTGTAAVNDDIMMLPNLVTAHSTCLKIHVVDPNSGTLILAASYENLAGTIVSLEVIPSSTGNTSGDTFDGLLLGFAGHPRMSIVYPGGDLNDLLVKQEGGADDDGLQSCWSGNLIASSILDLTPALIENSRGSVSCLEQDLSCSISSFTSQKNPTAAVILGGGVTVAMFQIPKSNSSSNTSWWRVASDPYFLPLTQLSKSLQTTQKSVSSTAASSSQSNKYSKSINNSALGGKVSHGFGDILSCAFLNGYTEPVIVLLHTNPYRQGGRACPGRLGLGDDSTSSRNTLSLTAVSVSIDQKRSVVLWTLRDAMPSGEMN